MMRFRYYIEDLFYFVSVLVLTNLPRPVGYWLMGAFGDFIFYCLKPRRQVALDNLRIAFGKEKTEQEIYGIARRVYQNFAKTALDVISLNKTPLWKFQKLAYIDGKEYLDEGRAKGKGIVMVTGHLGCWDILGFRLLQEGYPMTYVSGGFRNPMIDRVYNGIRENKGITVIPRRYALRGVVKSLQKNELLGIVSDQNAGETGAMVDFFGRKASTPKGAAAFTMRTGAMMVVVLDVPLEGRKLHRNIIRPVRIQATGDDEKDIFLYTQEFTRIIEEVVHEFPEHYFWLHRRWKYPPQPVA